MIDLVATALLVAIAAAAALALVDCALRWRHAFGHIERPQPANSIDHGETP